MEFMIVVTLVALIVAVVVPAYRADQIRAEQKEAFKQTYSADSYGGCEAEHTDGFALHLVCSGGTRLQSALDALREANSGIEKFIVTSRTDKVGEYWATPIGRFGGDRFFLKHDSAASEYKVAELK